MAQSNLIPFTIVAIIFLVVTFVSHYFYEEWLWKLSVESWIPALQGQSWWLWRRFVTFLSWFGWEILWLFVALFYVRFNRASSAFLIHTTSVMIWLVSVFKMYWNDPAPYMDRDYISALECNQNTFQNPSLEVTISAFAYSMMFYLAYDWVDIRRPRVRTTQGAGREGQPLFEDQEPEWFLSDGTSYQKNKANDFGFWLWLAVLIYIVFLVGYSAMYNGINSFDQVLFALCIGYGFFCIIYYFFKDFCVESLVKVSEKMVPSSSVLGSLVVHLIITGLFLAGARFYYGYQMTDYTVNPKWKSEHKDQCGLLAFPSFFDKELFNVYKFIYLSMGVAVGTAFDSLVLGGTRIDYNQVRSSEDRNPLLAFLLRAFITIGWILLTVLGGEYLLKMIIHRWLFVLALPYALCGFGLFTFLKYVFNLLGSTRAEIHPIPDVSAVELRRADRPPVAQ